MHGASRRIKVVPQSPSSISLPAVLRLLPQLAAEHPTVDGENIRGTISEAPRHRPPSRMPCQAGKASPHCYVSGCGAGSHIATSPRCTQACPMPRRTHPRRAKTQPDAAALRGDSSPRRHTAPPRQPSPPHCQPSPPHCQPSPSYCAVTPALTDAFPPQLGPAHCACGLSLLARPPAG
ncbi:hypothetical protein BJ912DRAFT_1091521 [Pholiota molesta]|nr:hypothetical protein BJ912DRAFT_1091521 [Pholiota molesta]